MTPHATRVSPMKSPLEAVHEYYVTFSTLDLPAIASHFTEPCGCTSSQGVFFAQTRAELETALEPMADALNAKGYGRSEFDSAEVIDLGPAAALVKGVAIRYASAGPELGRVPMSYLMHRSGDDWEIAVMVLP